MFLRARTRILAAVAVVGLMGFAGQASFGGSASVRTYVVQPGNTLWGISEEFHVSLSQLAAVNGMRLTDILPIGKRLVLPSASSGTRTTSVTSTSTKPASTANFCATYVAPSSPRGVLPAALADSPSRLALRPLFVQWADHYGISPALLEGIDWQESGWQEGVVSNAQAVGVGQILPTTAQFIQNDLVGSSLNLQSLSDNIRMSAAYLAYLWRAEGGNLCLTIAGYYQGAANLARHGVFAESVPYVESVGALIPRFE